MTQGNLYPIQAYSHATDAASTDVNYASYGANPVFLERSKYYGVCLKPADGTGKGLTETTVCAASTGTNTPFIRGGEKGAATCPTNSVPVCDLGPNLNSSYAKFLKEI